MIIPAEIHSVCFTGHRVLSRQEEEFIREKLSGLLSVLSERGLSECYAGGAVGFDTIAALSVLKLKSDHPSLKLNLILPCEGQEKSWNSEQKRIYNEIKGAADSVRILSPRFYNGCMQIRNRELLRMSDLCIAYLRPGTSGGGSLNTVIQAARLGIQIINLSDCESEDLQ